MPNVLIVDDHLAVRAGLRSVLRLDPSFTVVAAVADPPSAMSAARGAPVDVALVDYQLGDDNGAVLCHALKLARPEIGTLVYTAYDPRGFAVLAPLAGIDGVLGKGAPADELLAAIAAIARGERRRPELSHDVLRDAGRRVPPDDLPILGMRAADTPDAEIAEALGVSQEELGRRIDRLLEGLSPPMTRARPREECGSPKAQIQASPHSGTAPSR